MTEMQYPAQTPTGLTEADVRGTMIAALRMLGVLSVVAAGLFWWRAGWQSAVLLVVGSVISATSLWEYLRLMTAMNRSMDKGHTPRPMGLVAFGFILRLVLTVAVLYVSLKHLHGTVLALATGIGLGLVSLVYQASRLIRRPVV
jgi:hypothetical protein